MPRTIPHACAAILAVTALCLSSQSGCDKQGDPRPASASSSLNSAPADGGSTAHDRQNIREILTVWADGRTDAAIASLLKLAESDAPDEDFRPSLMSETAFVKEYTQQVSRTSAEEAGQWAKQQLAGYQSLGDFSQELVRRAQRAMDAGDHAAAKQLYSCLRRVGSANVGNDDVVCKMANLAGQSLIKMADEGLAQIPSSQSTGASQGS